MELSPEASDDAASEKLQVFSSGSESVSVADGGWFNGQRIDKQIIARKGSYILLVGTTAAKDDVKAALIPLTQSVADRLP